LAARGASNLRRPESVGIKKMLRKSHCGVHTAVFQVMKIDAG
jgi:hypothetical protein